MSSNALGSSNGSSAWLGWCSSLRALRASQVRMSSRNRTGLHLKLNSGNASSYTHKDLGNSGERLLRWGTSGKFWRDCERVRQNGSVRSKDDRQDLPRTNVEHRVLGNLNFGLERDRLKSRRFAPPALSEAHKG